MKCEPKVRFINTNDTPTEKSPKYTLAHLCKPFYDVSIHRLSQIAEKGTQFSLSLYVATVASIYT